jgi:hypothetical protein
METDEISPDKRKSTSKSGRDSDAFKYWTFPRWLLTLAAEPGATVVKTLLNDKKAVCYSHAFNPYEVCYGAIRRTDVRYASLIFIDLHAAGKI